MADRRHIQHEAVHGGGEGDNIRLVRLMQDDIGYFDLEACRVEPVENPFGPKVLAMSPV